MKFFTVFALVALSTLVGAAPVPVDQATTTTAVATPTRTPWALPTGTGTNTGVHCDPAFLRAADDDDSEDAELYRRACT